MTQIIGIAGRRGTGKDTVYRLVRESYDGRVERVAFADPLKVAAARALGYDDSERHLIETMDDAKGTWAFSIARSSGWRAARNGQFVPTDWSDAEYVTALTGRQYLQHFGTAMRETFGSDFWIDRVLPPKTDADIVCVTDVRYPREAERIRELGGVIWEAARPPRQDDPHHSERRLPRALIDQHIFNAGTLDDLRRTVEALLTKETTP